MPALYCTPNTKKNTTQSSKGCTSSKWPLEVFCRSGDIVMRGSGFLIKLARLSNLILHSQFFLLLNPMFKKGQLTTENVLLRAEQSSPSTYCSATRWLPQLQCCKGCRSREGCHTLWDTIINEQPGSGGTGGRLSTVEIGDVRQCVSPYPIFGHGCLTWLLWMAHL